MARPLRIQYPGALYHVTARGNAYQNIFRDDKDRFIFFDKLADVARVYGLICYAYCLMDNHYHLLLETPEANLSKAMRDLNGNYAQAFNVRHKTVGHLLQGRYKAFLIEKEPYLLSVVRYVVLNPVRAGWVKHPKDYRWSSYRATAGLARAPLWLATGWTLDLFSTEPKVARAQYRQFVGEDLKAESPLAEIREGTVLGSPQFAGWVWEEFGDCEAEKEITAGERMVSRPSLEDLLDGVDNKKERESMIKMARERGGYSLTEIANHLGMHRTTISKIFHKKANKT